MAVARGLVLIHLLAVASVVSFCVAAGEAVPSPGRRLLQATGEAWTPVPDAGDPRIQGLGNWAVSKHDRQTGDRLVFQQVSRAESQDVIGVDYHLHIKAGGGDAAGGGTSFVAVVWESTDSGMRKLISFDAE